jgi:hypothetical protein
MNSEAQRIWNRLRGVFVDDLSFSQIKNVAGTAGIPISELAHLVQQDGASKDALMSTVDSLFAKLPATEQDEYIADFVREAILRKPLIRERIEPVLSKLGCSIDEANNIINLPLSARPVAVPLKDHSMEPVIFISHSSKDLDVGDAILRLLKDAFGLRASEICYTSHPAYGLSGGADSTQSLRRKVVAAKLVVGLITTESVESQYVLFELGARWGADKPLIPLLAGGAQPSQLPKPLSAHALNCDSEDSLLRFISDCSQIIDRKADDTSAYIETIRQVVAASNRAAGEMRVDKKTLSELSAEILGSVQSEQDPNARGVTEIKKSRQFDRISFFTKLTDSGNPHELPAHKFRQAVGELVENGWLEAPEETEDVRVYRYAKHQA